MISSKFRIIRVNLLPFLDYFLHETVLLSIIIQEQFNSGPLSADQKVICLQKKRTRNRGISIQTELEMQWARERRRRRSRKTQVIDWNWYSLMIPKVSPKQGYQIPRKTQTIRIPIDWAFELTNIFTYSRFHPIFFTSLRSSFVFRLTGCLLFVHPYRDSRYLSDDNTRIGIWFGCSALKQVAKQRASSSAERRRSQQKR